MRRILSEYSCGKKHAENSTSLIQQEARLLLDDEVHSYISDDPVRDPASDRFNRWSFSKRVTQTIACRRDPSCIVVGIYGAWGEGKTTVLNFIEKELAEHENVIAVRFNPWRFGDETQLIRSFFSALAEALEKKISTTKEKIGELLESYADIITPIGLQFGVFTVSPGKVIKEVGGKLSSITLETLKERIEGILRKEKKRVVVLMDDIDRLDKSEIHVLFRLIKLTADFSYMSYILAFDDDMVAASLGDKYGMGNKEAGKDFLEKIVQVPLHLPKIETNSFRTYCLECIDEAIKMTGTQLDEEEAYRFYNTLVKGFEIRMKTPRIVKRYCNAATFSLPILRGEVNPVDLLLVEGIRVFYPTVYDVIKDNPNVFLDRTHLGYNSISDDEKRRRLDTIDNGLKDLSSDERECAKHVLKSLFPRIDGLGGIFGNVTYGSNQGSEWAEKKRIASKQYFYRYFALAVCEGDISDVAFESFLDNVEHLTPKELARKIEEFLKNGRADAFVANLGRKEKKLSEEVSSKLALALSLLGDHFPNPETFLMPSTYVQAAILISNLVENISDEEAGVGLAKEILNTAHPVAFSVEGFQRLTAQKDQKCFSEEVLRQLGELVAARVEACCSENKPVFIELPRETPRFLSVWSTWGSDSELKQYLTDCINEENVIDFVKCYQPTVWVGGSRLPYKGKLERENYDSIAKVINPDFIYDRLITKYGRDLEVPKEDDDGHRSNDEILAHQFARIHNYVRNAKNADNQS